jgi:hypothetical protein
VEYSVHTARQLFQNSLMDVCLLVVCNKITSPPAGKPPVLNMNTKPRESTRVTCQAYRPNSSCKKLALDSAVTKCAVTKFSRLDLCDV